MTERNQILHRLAMAAKDQVYRMEHLASSDNDMNDKQFLNCLIILGGVIDDMGKLIMDTKEHDDRP